MIKYNPIRFTMKYIFIFIALLFLGCNNASNTQFSSIEDSEVTKTCRRIELFFDCFFNHVNDFLIDGTLVGLDERAGFKIGHTVGMACVKEITDKHPELAPPEDNTDSGPGLDFAEYWHGNINNCARSIKTAYSEADAFTQLLSCKKRKLKKDLGC